MASEPTAVNSSRWVSILGRPVSSVTAEWERENPMYAQRLLAVYEDIAGVFIAAVYEENAAGIATSVKDGSLPPVGHRAAVMGAVESMKLYDGVVGDEKVADDYIHWLPEFVLALHDKHGVPPGESFQLLEEDAVNDESVGFGDWLIRCFMDGMTAEEAAAEVPLTMESQIGPGDGQSRTKVICESHDD